jgi:hypothetical protein
MKTNKYHIGFPACTGNDETWYWIKTHTRSPPKRGMDRRITPFFILVKDFSINIRWLG